jgi:hypothetical protein
MSTKRRKAKFYLYRNLRTGGFSIKQHGLVCDRGDIFVMHNVEFHVSDAGNARAKKEQQRNVHAYMVAEEYEKLNGAVWHEDSNLIRVTYHPFKDSTFVIADTGEPILHANYAIAIKGKVYVK